MLMFIPIPFLLLSQMFTFTKEFFSGHKTEVVAMTISPNQEMLALVLAGYGLVTFPCGKVGWGDETDIKFEDAVLPSGQTVALASVENNAMLVTTSLDNTLRIWPSIRDSKEIVDAAISFTFDEVPLAIAMHPSGHGLLLGFSKHVSFYHILLDTIVESHPLNIRVPIRMPLQIKYSDGGDRFCITTGQHLFVYDSVSFVLLQYVPTGKQLKTFSWSQNGDFLAVCTIDGGLLVYELAGLSLVSEFTDKGLQYHDVILDWGRRWRHEENLGQPLSAAKKQHTLADHQEHTIGSMLAQQAERLHDSSGMTSSDMNAMVSVSKSQANHRSQGTVVASAGGAYHKVQVMRHGHVMDLNVINDDSTSDSE